MTTFTVQCEWDDQAEVWYVAESNVPGLVAEATTQEAMTALLRERIPELVRLNMSHLAEADGDVPLDLLYKRHANIRLSR